MSRCIPKALACFVLGWFAVVGCPTKANAELIINLDFSDFTTGAPADGSDTLGGATLAQAQTVIETAAEYWEIAFANSSSSINWVGQGANNGGTLTQDIAVTWAPKPDNVLATGGTGFLFFDGRWDGGTLSWDNDGSSQFFVDTTPGEHSEWNQFSERDHSHGGISMNSERVHYDAPPGTVRDSADMLSVAVHEIGHALGFGGLPAYLDADLGNDSDIDITSGDFSGAQIAIHGGHTEFLIESPPGGDFPYDPGEGSFFPPFDYNPSLMGPSIVTGTRKLLTEVDIAIVAQYLEFDMSTVNFNPQISAVPEPSSFAVLGAGLLYVVRRRRRKV